MPSESGSPFMWRTLLLTGLADGAGGPLSLSDIVFLSVLNSSRMEIASCMLELCSRAEHWRTAATLICLFWAQQATALRMDPSCPNVSIPCYNEQRDKKKRYTVSDYYFIGYNWNNFQLFMTLLEYCFCLVLGDLSSVLMGWNWLIVFKF